MATTVGAIKLWIELQELNAARAQTDNGRARFEEAVELGRLILRVIGLDDDQAMIGPAHWAEVRAATGLGRNEIGGLAHLNEHELRRLIAEKRAAA